MDTAFYAARSFPRTRIDARQDTQLKALEDENIRLKLLLAEAVVENAALKMQDCGSGGGGDDARGAGRPEHERGRPEVSAAPGKG